MKKIALLAILTVFAVSAALAQITPKGEKSILKNTQVQTPSKIINTVPPTPGSPPPPPPPPATSTNKITVTGNQNASVYSLTSARVTIRTGNDNKEFPSEVGVMLRNRSSDGGWIMQQPPQNMRNEMKSNTNTEFGLEKMTDNPFPQCMTLESIQRGGLQLRIFYLPNLFTDAWRIEGVSITLEFRDQNGNLHPTLGSKTIVCNNASGFLDGSNHILMCYTDGQFVPTTSSIQP
jgi:hypothetical protein